MNDEVVEENIFFEHPRVGFSNTGIVDSLVTTTTNNTLDESLWYFNEQQEPHIPLSQLKEFYEWLKCEAKEIEQEEDDSTSCIDDITDKMEEMFDNLIDEIDIEFRTRINAYLIEGD